MGFMIDNNFCFLSGQAAWKITGEDRAKHDSQFFQLKPVNGFITGIVILCAQKIDIQSPQFIIIILNMQTDLLIKQNIHLNDVFNLQINFGNC